MNWPFSLPAVRLSSFNWHVSNFGLNTADTSGTSCPWRGVRRATLGCVGQALVAWACDRHVSNQRLQRESLVATYQKRQTQPSVPYDTHLMAPSKSVSYKSHMARVSVWHVSAKRVAHVKRRIRITWSASGLRSTNLMTLLTRAVAAKCRAVTRVRVFGLSVSVRTQFWNKLTQRYHLQATPTNQVQRVSTESGASKTRNVLD